MKKTEKTASSHHGTLLDWNVFSETQTSLYAAAFLLLALLAAYLPVIQGYYLHIDDFWGFVSDYKNLQDNPMFNTQANMAGRPLGALIMSFLQSQVKSLNDANLVRGALIVVPGSVSFLFYLWLRCNYVKPVMAVLVSAAIFTLPSFHSGIYCITDSYSIYGLLPAIVSGFLVFKAVSTSVRRNAFLFFLLSVILLFLSLLIYPFTAMFYWVLIAIFIARQDGLTVTRMWGRLAVMFLAPFTAIVSYFVYFRLTQKIDSTNSVIIDVADKFRAFIASPLGAALNFWHVPHQTLNQLDVWGIYRIKWFACVSVGVWVVGLVVTIAKDIRARSGEESRGVTIASVAFKYFLLAGLFPLAMLPYMASTWTTVSFRYLVSLSPLVFLSIAWIVFHVVSAIPINGFQRVKDKVLVVGLIAALLIGIYSTHYYLMHDIVTPQSAEIRYFKSVLGQYNPAQIRKIHVIRSTRQFPDIEHFGFQSTVCNGEWNTALVRTALKELALDKSEFVEAVKFWSIGKLTEVVTSSDKRSVEDGSVLIEPSTVLIDLTKIEFLIDPWIDFSGVQGKSFTLRVGGKEKPAVTSGFQGKGVLGYSMNLCVGGVAISGGDYPGFPALQAFDEDDVSSRWGSLQTGREIRGNAYIGYDFGDGKEKHIRRVGIRQGGAIKSVKVQRSSDGIGWHDAKTLDIMIDHNMRVYDLPESEASRFWRILANDDLGEGPSAWTIYGVKMMEKETA